MSALLQPVCLGEIPWILSFFFLWSDCVACGVLISCSGWNLCPLPWKCGVLNTRPPGKSLPSPTLSLLLAPSTEKRDNDTDFTEWKTRKQKQTWVAQPPASVVWQDGAKKDETPGEEGWDTKRRSGGDYGLIIQARTWAEMPSKSGNHPESHSFPTVISKPRGFWKESDWKKGKRDRERCFKIGHWVHKRGREVKTVLKQRSSCPESERGNRGSSPPGAPSHLTLPHACGRLLAKSELQHSSHGAKLLDLCIFAFHVQGLYTWKKNLMRFFFPHSYVSPLMVQTGK